MDNVRVEYLWCIENYSFCRHKKGEVLLSPEFITDGLEGNAWQLQLFPRGETDEDEGYISLFLYRSLIDGVSAAFLVNCELGILKADGSTVHSVEFYNSFNIKEGHGSAKFLHIKQMLLQPKDFLPADILTVRCKIWKGEGDPQQFTQISARTRIRTEQISFLHVIEGFSELELYEEKTLEIPFPTRKERAISSRVYFTDCSFFEGKVMVETTPPDPKLILSKIKLSLLDASGNAVKCGEADIPFDVRRQDIPAQPLSLSREAILNRKHEFLPDDELSLLCECVFSSGIEYENIEKTLHGVPSAVLNEISNDDQNNDRYNAAEKLSVGPSAQDAWKTIYENQFLTDVELKTKTNSFPAHKIVLFARSSVFKAMLTHDMKEKTTDCIKIDDLEDDTVGQLLLFLYCDTLENLQWESALKLYYAGDKYNIEKLKVVCSSFLINNLNTVNVGELLFLADTHNDSDLKKLVEDFILENEDEVFGSEEWEKLIEANPKLVVKTMHLKYRRKKLRLI